MTNWREFERSCVNYLNNRYGNEVLNFQGSGMSDSTVSDIAVIKNGKVDFYIESKMNKAQSGQFVLLDVNGCFVFSHRNKSDINEFSQLILDYINNNYDCYKNVSTKSTPINLPKQVFEQWIKSYYKTKDVKYVITSDTSGEYIIFPVDKYGEYFEINGNFRVKKSGSRNLSKKYETTLKNLIENNYGLCNISWNEKKAYCKTNANIPDKTKINGNDYSYQLNRVDSSLYEIRMLSNTANANVIFSINLIQEQQLEDLSKFINNIE